MQFSTKRQELMSMEHHYRTWRSSETCRRTSARDSASSRWPTTTSVSWRSSPSTGTRSATGCCKSASRQTIESLKPTHPVRDRHYFSVLRKNPIIPPLSPLYSFPRLCHPTEEHSKAEMEKEEEEEKVSTNRRRTLHPQRTFNSTWLLHMIAY